MKKTLIALAVLAVSGAAFAQSTVTLSGKANIGLIKETSKDLKAAGGADGSASRLIFRGTEDLGGGLKANFHMEQGVDLGTGATDAVTFQRQAWMGLSGGFGEIRAGRQYTLGFMSSIGYMPSTYANAQVAVLADTKGFNGVGSRNDAQIRYTSPSLSGLVVEAATQLKGNTTTALTEVVVRYAAGPLKAGLYNSSTKGTSGNNLAINGSYDLSGVLLAGGYIDRAGTGTGKVTFVHAGTTMGAFSPYVQFATNADNKQDAIEVGARYALSKRTAGYFHLVNNSDATIASGSKGIKSKMALGLDHNF